MIPNKPDHPFVYWATYPSCRRNVKCGAKIFIYDNGFILQKPLLSMDNSRPLGPQLDVRSFKLNFEVNAFLIREGIAKSLTDSYLKDIEVSKSEPFDEYQQSSLIIRFKESISRLLSPIL